MHVRVDQAREREPSLAIHDLAGGVCRDTRLEPGDLRGAGITLSNLGALGVSSMQPLVNWPEVAIIGVDHDRMDNNLSRQRLSTIPFLPSKIGHQAVAALNTLLQGGSDTRLKKSYLVLPEPIEIGSTTRESSNDELVNRALAFIRANFHKGIKAEQVALALGVSRSHLSMRFKRQLGTSVHDNLLQARLSFAAQQLVDTEQPIAEIASQVGFASKTYLFQCFKQHFQMLAKQRQIMWCHGHIFVNERRTGLARSCHSGENPSTDGPNFIVFTTLSNKSGILA